MTENPSNLRILLRETANRIKDATRWGDSDGAKELREKLLGLRQELQRTRC